MIKKAFAALAVAGVLALAGASAASAEEYPADLDCTAAPGTIAVGETSVVSCTGVIPGDVVFTVTGAGVVSDTLSSIVAASTSGTSTVTKVANEAGEVSVNFLGPAVGSFEVTATDSQENTRSATVTVTAADEGEGEGEELPPTGGTVPAAAIWLGVGAIGIGGIAVAAAVARRRAAARR